MPEKAGCKGTAVVAIRRDVKKERKMDIQEFSSALKSHIRG